MDLAWDAFSAIAFPHVGSVNVEFNRVDCDRVNLGPYEARSTLMQEGRLGAALETASYKAGGSEGKYEQETVQAQSTDVEARYTGRRLRRLMHDGACSCSLTTMQCRGGTGWSLNPMRRCGFGLPTQTEPPTQTRAPA